MTTKTKTHLFLVVVLLLVLGGLWPAWIVLRSTNRTLADVIRRREALTVLTAKTQARIASNQRDVALLEGPPDSAGRPVAPFSNPGSPASARPGPNLAALLESNPGLMALYLRSFRANLADRLAMTYERLGLSPGQVDKVEDLATEHEQEIMDLRVAAATQGLPMRDGGISALRREADQEYQSALTAAIGESAGRQIAQAPAISGVLQGVLDNLAEVAALSPAPMTYAKMAELTPMLAGATATSPRDESPSIAWNRLVAQAGGSLSAAQQDVLQSMDSLNVVNGLVREYYAQQSPARNSN